MIAASFIPANMFVYATSDASYVEKVSSTLDVESLNTEEICHSNYDMIESTVDVEILKSEGDDISPVIQKLDANIPVEIADVTGIDVSKSDTYSLLIGKNDSNNQVMCISNVSDELIDKQLGMLNTVEPEEILKTSDANDKQLVEVSSDLITVEKNSKTVETMSSEDVKADEKAKPDVSDKVGNDNVETPPVIIVNNETPVIEVEVSGSEEVTPVKPATPETPEDITTVEQDSSDAVTMTVQQNALLSIESPDLTYTGATVILSDADKEMLTHLVMGEAGNQGYEGAALVAQAIRDTMVTRGYSSVDQLRKDMKYSASLSNEPNQDVLNAVSYVFDNGGNAVQHEIIYFYAHKKVNSGFHESQEFVVEYGGHRFFDTW